MRLSLLAAAVLFSGSLAAHADSVFNLSAAVPNAQLTGTGTLNAASTAFTINLTFTNGAIWISSTALVSKCSSLLVRIIKS